MPSSLERPLASYLDRPTFFLRTFGCQMNEHDSERIHGLLASEGLSRVTELDQASIVVYNTCTVRGKADTRLLGHLAEVRTRKSKDPSLLVVVAGCHAQSQGERLLEEHPYIDVVVGPQSLFELVPLLRQRLEEGKRGAALAPVSSRFSADLPRVRPQSPTAWVQIMTGCTNFCSYCIVPYVRGPERSRPEAAIVAEVRALVGQGVREVTLLGQNVNAYGKERGSQATTDFVGLLWQLAEIEGLWRIRFMTSHPKDVSPALIRALADCPPVCEHLHLPVQSGSDRILAAMRRGYTFSHYKALVERIREAVPDLALTTDLIVGFPGETEEDFEATLRLVEECSFDTAFTFIFSPRPGTRAASMPERVPRHVAERRVSELIRLVQRKSREANERLVGTNQEVLIEGIGQDGRPFGRTRTHKLVHIEAEGACAFRQPEPGMLVQVTVEAATSATLRARLV